MVSFEASEAAEVDPVTTRVEVELVASSSCTSLMAPSNLDTPLPKVDEISRKLNGIPRKKTHFNLNCVLGGSGSEAGGPGVTYFNGGGGSYSNLRVDNKCQLPEVTLPSSYFADDDDYNTMLETGKFLPFVFCKKKSKIDDVTHIQISTGAITRLIGPTDDHVFEFSIVEIYGGTHLAFTSNSSVRATRVVGDDTGKIIVGPHQMLDINGVSS